MLLAVKVVGLKRKSAARPKLNHNHAAQVRLGPGLNHFQSLTDENFAALFLP